MIPTQRRFSMTEELNWKKRKEMRKKRKDSGNYPSEFDRQQREGQNNWTAIAPWVQFMYVGTAGFNVLYAIAISLWYLIDPISPQWAYLLLLLIALGIGAGMYYIYFHQKNFIRIGFFVQVIMGFFAVLSSLGYWPSWIVMTGAILNGIAVLIDYGANQKLDRNRMRNR